MEPDPIGLEGGLNPYSYCYNNPVNYIDPTGAIPVPLISGAIGLVAGGGSSAIFQLINNKGTKNFSWSDVGVAAGVGAVAGAAAPYTAMTYAGAAVTGAIAGEYQYLISSAIKNQPVTMTGLSLNTGAGFFSGPLAGKFSANPKLEIGPFTSIGSAKAQSINNLNTNRANVAASSIVRNVVTGVGNGYSTSDQAVNLLNQNLYGSYQNANYNLDINSGVSGCGPMCTQIYAH